jgi:hypothetical protein
MRHRDYSGLALGFSNRILSALIRIRDKQDCKPCGEGGEDLALSDLMQMDKALTAAFEKAYADGYADGSAAGKTA